MKDIDLSYIPADYPRIHVVDSMDVLFTAKFEGAVNCIVHPRRLKGDFNALAVHVHRVLSAPPVLQEMEFYQWSYRCTGTTSIMLPHVKFLFGDVAADMRMAADAIESDIGILEKYDDVSFLRVDSPAYYARINKGTSICQFHTDGGNGEKGRVLACYTDPVTEYLRDDNGGVHAFRSGDIWRQAVDETVIVRAFEHRMPEFSTSGTARLLVLT